MATAIRVAGKKQQQGRWQQGRLWWAKMRVVAMGMRFAVNKEGKGGMAMVTVKRMVAKQQRREQRGQWQWRRGWQARMRAMVRAVRTMAIATKRATARKRAYDVNKTTATETTTMLQILLLQQ
jgi:hypothetical protein